MTALAILKPRNPTERTIQQRITTGRGYSNPELEEKRLAAIKYLRYQSMTGWLVDKLCQRMPRAK